MAVIRLPYRYSTVRPVPRRVSSPLVWSAAFGASLFAIPVLAAAGALSGSAAALAVYCVLAALVGAFARVAAAPVTALVTWMVYDGFAVHRFGNVSWDGAADIRRLALLLVATLLGTGISHVVSAFRAHHRIPHQEEPATGRW
jgi:fatty acid desaturase